MLALRLARKVTTRPSITSFLSFNSFSTEISKENAIDSTEISKENAIETKLREVVAATHVNVEDISGGCGSMYKIFVVSPEFEGLALEKQHRLVQKAIAGEIADMHGLTLKTQTAKQYKKSKNK